jgi:hypothetical protein
VTLDRGGCGSLSNASAGWAAYDRDALRNKPDESTQDSGSAHRGDCPLTVVDRQRDSRLVESDS